MKTILSFIMFMSVLTGVSAQGKLNLVIFSDEGDPFYAVINGIKQNVNPETNVKITDLNANSISIKIIFKNTNIKPISKNVYLEFGNEYTVRIKKDKKGVPTLRLFGQVAMEQSTSTAPVVVYRTTEIPVTGGTTQGTTVNTVNTGTVNNGTTGTTTVQTTEKVTTTTTGGTTGVTTGVTTGTGTAGTTVNTGTTGTGENVNISMNVNGMGVSMNVNAGTTGTTTGGTTTTGTTGGTTTGITGGTTSTQTITTTTTTTVNGTSGTGTGTQGTATNTTGNIAPVNTGTTVNAGTTTNTGGCYTPVSETEFAEIKKSISSKSFSDSKMQIAQQVVKSNCLSSVQIREIMKLFDFEGDRLEFAKFAYSFTFDKNNYYKVNDAFDFESSIDELNAFIKTK
jgi:hypothetical protein